VAARLSDIPGASDVLAGGVVAYANDVKTAELGVPEELIAAYGAVSAEVAAAMASGVRARLGVDVGIAVTGVAGPGGGTPEKPVGLVFIALSGAAGDRVRRVHFPSDRDRVRYQSTQSALEMIRRGLLGLSPL
jgi:PncC family amidohydrolase